jgi:hypothetical protein
MGLAMMDSLDTEEECIRVVKRIGDIVTGKFLAKDYEENLENEASNDRTKFISWNQFETQYKCKRHGYIDSGKCPQCQALPVEQQPEKKPL